MSVIKLTRGAAFVDAIATIIHTHPECLCVARTSSAAIDRSRFFNRSAGSGRQLPVGSSALVGIWQLNVFHSFDADDEFSPPALLKHSSITPSHALFAHHASCRANGESENYHVREAGARRACLAALDSSDAQPLADSCLVGEEALRFGAAQVLAANLGDARFRSYCESKIEPSFQTNQSAFAMKQLRVFVA